MCGLPAHPICFAPGGPHAPDRPGVLSGWRAFPGERLRNVDRSARWFVLAGVVGVLHAAFSGYWAAGGRWMLATVGTWASDWTDRDPATAGMVLLILAIVKLTAALLPIPAARGTTPLAWLVLGLAWPGAILLLLWGGVSFAGAGMGLVLTSGPHTVQYGHLFFDGLFLVWGAALFTGLIHTRRTTRA